MIFSFKYKLTLLISSIVLVSLLVSFYVTEQNLEQKFIISIENELTETNSLITELMRNRIKEMQGSAYALSGSRLLRDLLLDKSMDKITRNDIIEEEILPDFPSLSSLIVTDVNGDVLAANARFEPALKQLQQQPFFAITLNGEQSIGYIFIAAACVQLYGIPVFLREEMIGILWVGADLTEKYIEKIKQLSGVDLALFNKNRIFLHSGTQYKAIETRLNTEKNLWQKDTVSQIIINKERVLLISVDKKRFIPPYVLFTSLDKEMEIVKKIRSGMIKIGLICLLFGVIIAFIFSLNISRPITQLRLATQEVERENFDYKFSINTRDEFKLLGHSFQDMLNGLNEKEKIRNAMNKVVSKEIADELLKGDVKLGGEERIVTILTTDIRGFTTLSEGFSPEQLLDFLNNYFTRQSFCIDAHNGVIDKYVGDAMMALFGAPITRENDATHAVLAGLDILQSVRQFNVEVAKVMNRTINIGISLNTGVVVAGNLGAENRLNYTVLGDTVNTAFRLEGLNKRYGVEMIISESTYQVLMAENTDNDLPCVCRLLDNVQVKGKNTAVKIYQVMSIINEDKRSLIVMSQQYEKAWSQLLSGTFSPAYNPFSQYHEQYPDDGPGQIMQIRCLSYIDNRSLFEQEYVNGTYIFHEK